MDILGGNFSPVKYSQLSLSRQTWYAYAKVLHVAHPDLRHSTLFFVYDWQGTVRVSFTSWLLGLVTCVSSGTPLRSCNESYSRPSTVRGYSHSPPL